MKKRFYYAVLALFLLPCLLGRAEALNVKVNPPLLDLAAAGSTLLIQVNIEDVSDLGGLEFKLSFNPSVLGIGNQSQVVEGAFLSGAQVWRKDISTPGIFKYGATITPGAGGSGTLVEISFDVLDTLGCTRVGLYDLVLSDTSFNRLDVDSVQNATAQRCGGILTVIILNVLNE